MQDLLLKSITDFPVADLIFAALLVLFFLIGFHKGFIDTLFWLFGTLGALVIAYFTCKEVAGILDKNFGLMSIFTKFIRGLLPGSDYMVNIDVSEPGGLSNALQGANLPAFIADQISKVISLGPLPENTYLIDVLSPLLGSYLLITVSFLGVFIAVKIIFLIISMFFESTDEKFGTLDAINRFFGGALALAVMFCFLYIIVTVILFLPLSVTQPVVNQIDKSVAVKAIYYNNIAIKYFESNSFLNIIREFVTKYITSS